MTGILLVLEIIAFLVVAWWVYLRADAGDDTAETGLLGMKSSTRAPGDSAPKRKAPSPRGAPVPSARAPDISRRTGPRWKTVRRRPGRPF